MAASILMKRSACGYFTIAEFCYETGRRALDENLSGQVLSARKCLPKPPANCMKQATVG